MLKFQKFLSDHIINKLDYPDYKSWTEVQYTNHIKSRPVWLYDKDYNMTPVCSEERVRNMANPAAPRIKYECVFQKWAHDKEYNTIIISSEEEVKKIFTKQVPGGFITTEPIEVVDLYRKSYYANDAWQFRSEQRYEMKYVATTFQNGLPVHYLYSSSTPYLWPYPFPKSPVPKSPVQVPASILDAWEDEPSKRARKRKICIFC